MGADQVVRCIYLSPDGLTCLEMWANYYANAAAGLKHSPEVCFGLGGWRLVSIEKLGRSAGCGVPASVARFVRQGRRCMAVSTFLLGSKFYATQPEAKYAYGFQAVFGRALPLIHLQVVAQGSAEAELPEQSAVEMLEVLAGRLRAQVAAMAGEQQGRNNRQGG